MCTNRQTSLAVHAQTRKRVQMRERDAHQLGNTHTNVLYFLGPMAYCVCRGLGNSCKRTGKCIQTSAQCYYKNKCCTFTLHASSPNDCVITYRCGEETTSGECVRFRVHRFVCAALGEATGSFFGFTLIPTRSVLFRWAP